MNRIRLRKVGLSGRFCRKAGRWGLGACSGLLVAAAGACGPPTENVLSDAEGQSIRLEGIDRILENDNLTEEEKRERLRGLGITDERLIDALIQAS